MLTPRGEEVFAKAEQDARAVGKSLLAGFDPDERIALTGLLTRFVAD